MPELWVRNCRRCDNSGYVMSKNDYNLDYFMINDKLYGFTSVERGCVDVWMDLWYWMKKMLELLGGKSPFNGAAVKIMLVEH